MRKNETDYSYNWTVDGRTLSDEEMRKIQEMGLKRDAVTRRIMHGWPVDKAISEPPKDPVAHKKKIEKEIIKSNPRIIIRGKSLAEVKVRVGRAKQRGWEPLMDEPKYDPGDWFTNQDDSYVMVMENKNLKEGKGAPKWAY